MEVSHSAPCFEVFLLFIKFSASYFVSTLLGEKFCSLSTEFSPIRSDRYLASHSTEMTLRTVTIGRPPSKVSLSRFDDSLVSEAGRFFRFSR